VIVAWAWNPEVAVEVEMLTKHLRLAQVKARLLSLHWQEAPLFHTPQNHGHPWRPFWQQCLLFWIFLPLGDPGYCHPLHLDPDCSQQALPRFLLAIPNVYELEKGEQPLASRT
jgi:hypothetical protein